MVSGLDNLPLWVSHVLLKTEITIAWTRLVSHLVGKTAQKLF